MNKLKNFKICFIKLIILFKIKLKNNNNYLIIVILLVKVSSTVSTNIQLK